MLFSESDFLDLFNYSFVCLLATDEKDEYLPVPLKRACSYLLDSDDVFLPLRFLFSVSRS